MGLESSKDKLLSIAVSIDPEVIGVGQTPPYIELGKQSGDLYLPDIQNQSKNFKNNDDQLYNVRLETGTIVPYETTHIFDHDIPAIRDILSARKMENQLDNLILTKLYELTDINNPELIIESLAKIDIEISDTKSDIAAIESLQNSLEQSKQAFNQDLQKDKLTERYHANIAALNPDNLVSDENMIEDIDSLVSKMTGISIESYKKLNSTGRFFQLLADAEWTLGAGISPSFLISSIGKRDNVQGSIVEKFNYSRPASAVAYYAGYFPPLSTVGLGDNNVYDGIFDENVMTRIPKATTLSKIEKVGYYCAILSKEFMLSAGLGRVDGSPLGQSFGSAQEPMLKLFGTKNVISVHDDFSVENNSLADFAVTDINGNTNVKTSEEKNVYIFESSVNIDNNNNALSAKTAWIDTIKTDPGNNSASNLDKVLVQAEKRFENAEFFLRQIAFRDEDRTLLKPRGLFARIIRDFAKLLEGITAGVDQDAQNSDAESLILLKLAQKKYSLPPGKKSLKRGIIAGAAIQQFFDRVNSNNSDPVVRLTAEDSESNFLQQSGPDTTLVLEMNEVLLRLGETEENINDPGDLVTIKKNGSAFFDMFNNSGKNGLKDIIGSLFVDLQNEALLFARLEDNTKTYLRSGNTTNFSGFDGAIVLAIVSECFSLLADIFCPINFYLNNSLTEAAKSLKEYVNISANNSLDNTLTDNQQSSGTGSTQTSTSQTQVSPDLNMLSISFALNDHKIVYKGGPDSKLNKTRRFLLELAASAETNDTSNLLDSAGDVVSVEGLSETDNLAVGNNVVRPLDLVDLVNSISKEDDIPMQHFALAKSMVEVLKEQTSDIIQKAEIIAGKNKDIKDLPSDIARLQEIGKSNIGSKFIKGITPQQLRHANKRIQRFENLKEKPYFAGKISVEMFQALELLFEQKQGETDRSVILFLGLPTNTLQEDLISKDLLEESSRLRFNLQKNNEIENSFESNSLEKVFSLKYSVTESAIIESFAAEFPPATFSELVLSISYDILGEDEPIAGSELLNSSIDPTGLRDSLQLTLESFLLKKAIEIINGTTLMPENVQFDQIEERDNSTKQLLGSILPMANIEKEDFSLFLKSDANNMVLPSVSTIEQMVQPKPAIIDGIDTWKKPDLTPAQINVIYSLFTTKPFFVGKINDIILSRSIFDDVYAIIIRLKDFDENIDYSNKFKIESLYISAELEGE